MCNCSNLFLAELAHSCVSPTVGDTFSNVNTGSKKERVPRLVRMHADEMEEITEVRYEPSPTITLSSGMLKRSLPATPRSILCRSGEIAALFGVDCNSGDTFTTGTRCTLTSMFVPPAVVSLAISMSKVASAEHPALPNPLQLLLYPNSL